MKKKGMWLVVLIITLMCFNPSVYAGSLSASSNTTSTVTGSTITVTVRASGLTGKFSITSSNSNILSGGTSSEWIENETKTYKFTAKSIGSANIVIKAIDVADSNGNPFSGSKTININVVKPREKSTNNNLKNLGINGYDLSPTFNKNTLEYTTTVESNVEKITITASKEDNYASVSGTGEKDVVEGDNKFEIKVTSETGSSKTYTVNVIVKDNNPITKVVDGKNYTIVKRASALTKPETFDDTKITIDDMEIPAFYSEKLSLTLIGLKDENGNIYLYKYDAKTNSLERYSQLTSNAKTIIFENTNDSYEGYTKTKVNINNEEYEVLQNNINKDYVLIYGTDLENNTKNWYLYNLKENSIQLYMSDVIDNINSNFNKTIKEYKTVILAMSGLSIVLLIVIIILVFSKSKPKKVKSKKNKEPEESLIKEK